MKMINGWLDGVWVLLLAGTAFTWWLGESGHAGGGAVLAILTITFAKGCLVILEFMALRGVKLWWQALVIGWLLLVLVVNMAAYWKGI
jgi:hypothetical protein